MELTKRSIPRVATASLALGAAASGCTVTSDPVVLIDPEVVDFCAEFALYGYAPLYYYDVIAGATYADPLGTVFGAQYTSVADCELSVQDSVDVGFLYSPACGNATLNYFGCLAYEIAAPAFGDCYTEYYAMIANCSI